MSKIKELQAKADQCLTAKKTVEDRHLKRYHELHDILDAQLEREFGSQLEAAEQAYQQAIKSFQQVQDNKVIAEASLPYPEGTVVCSTFPWEQRGVIQIFRRGNAFVGKNYSPKVGDVVIRLLLKNGKLGKHTLGWSWVNKKLWKPEAAKK